MERTHRSYFHRGGTVPLLGETIPGHFAGIVEKFPSHEAVVSLPHGRRVSYAGLAEAVDQLARGLLGIGFQKGDRIGVWSTNNIEWLLLQMATARIGAVLVTINPAYRTRELAYALQRSEVQGLFSIPAFRSSDYIAMLVEMIPELREVPPAEFRSREFPYLRRVVLYDPAAPLKTDRPFRGFTTWSDVLATTGSVSGEELEKVTAFLDMDDTVNIQYTSGTTGFPKAVMLTHHNILNNAYFVASAMCFSEKDRLCVSVPFYHCFGMVLANLLCLTVGACIVIPCEHFDALAVVQAIDTEKCTAVHGVPTMFIAELERPEFKAFDRSSLRQITWRLKELIIRGGENIYPREIEDFIFTHPKVAEVAVFGIPDDYYGEEGMAWIQLHAGETATADDIRNFCKGKIAHFKIPGPIWFVGEFPLTVTGKLQKFRMREMAIEKMRKSQERR